MRTRSSSNLIVESSTTLKRRNRRHSKQRVKPFSLEETSLVTMADQRTMAKLLQAPTEGYGDAIVIPDILAENFKLKHGLLNLVTLKQFYGFEKEDPHAHIRWFNKITSTIKYKDVPNSSIKLMLFPFSIEGAARIWLEKEPPRSILTWEDLVSKFINQFFPPSKTTNLRNKITNFQQKFEETFSEACDHFKDLLRACPHHACPSEMAALTDAVNAMLRHDKTSPSETVKAIYESGMTCGGPHPYYECLAADGNTFNASAAATTYNQNQGYRPQGDLNYRASNQMGPPEIVECLALADLGASINLMPLSCEESSSLPNLLLLQIILDLQDDRTTSPILSSLRRFNRIDVIDVSCEEYVQEVLGFLDSSTSGNPTPSLDHILFTSFPSLTPFEGGDFILEEIEACLSNDSIPPRIDDADFDPEGDLLLLEKLLNDDPSSLLPPKELHFEEIKTIKSSIDDPSELKLKDLPSHLKYAFLEGTDKLPVIISKKMKKRLPL
ncbi:reverse transcriptase domain-containing protein [Tanacetum coccineum]